MKTTCASCASSSLSRAGASQYEAIAELYDGYPGNYLEDISFFVEEAKRAGPPVLEVGVGTGRLALCLASVGIDVVGIDSSPAMLRVLARKRAGLPRLSGQVRTVAADMRRFALGERFPLAIIPFRTFLYLLTRADQRRALRAVWRHLRPGGRLVMAFFVPRPELIATRRTARKEMTRFAAPDGQGEVVASDWTEVSPGQQVISHLSYKWIRENEQPVRRLEHTLVARYLFPEEVRPLLEECRYRVVDVFGDFARGPLTAASREQIWVAERTDGQERGR